MQRRGDRGWQRLAVVIGLALFLAAMFEAAAAPEAVAPPARAASCTAPSPPAFAKAIFEFRCHGQDAWVRWGLGTRDCTGRYPMFPEGEVSRTWCPRGAGAFPDLPWRRAQAGTADWRIVDETGALLTALVGPCVTDPSVFDRIDGRLHLCRSEAYPHARDVYAAGCTQEDFHTGPAVFAGSGYGFLPSETIISFMLGVPPYDAYPNH